MKSISGFLSTAVCLLGMSQSTVIVQNLCSGFVPPNDKYIPVGLKDGEQGITQDEFNTLLDRLDKVYAPIVEAKGGTLKINRKWEDGTVNAYAERIGTSWEITMFGGLARYKNMTADGFMLVACHELGHQLGGKPKVTSFFGKTSWAAVEGQSDYFGTAKCMKRMFMDMTQSELSTFKSASKTADDACAVAYKDPNDQLICQRDAAAGIVLGNVLSDLGSDGVVTLETPSTEVARGIDQKHPKAQCRLDTYFQGAACNVNYGVDFSDTDQITGACSKAAGFTQGLRPACWFNPKDGQGALDQSPVSPLGFDAREVYF